ncbi:hypothetical protein D3C87_1434570 [compost metagenome]
MVLLLAAAQVVGQGDARAPVVVGDDVPAQPFAGGHEELVGVADVDGRPAEDVVVVRAVVARPHGHGRAEPEFPALGLALEHFHQRHAHRVLPLGQRRGRLRPDGRCMQQGQR